MRKRASTVLDLARRWRSIASSSGPPSSTREVNGPPMATRQVQRVCAAKRPRQVRSNQTRGPPSDVVGDEIEHQIKAAAVFHRVLVGVYDLLSSKSSAV